MNNFHIYQFKNTWFCSYKKFERTCGKFMKQSLEETKETKT